MVNLEDHIAQIDVDYKGNPKFKMPDIIAILKAKKIVSTRREIFFDDLNPKQREAYE